MSEGSGPGAGVFVGAGVGACVVIVGIVAVVVYCYMKSRKEKAHTNMTKSNEVFSTAASNTHYDHPPPRSKVNRYPDPERERRARRQEKERDKGHVNPAFSRHASDNSSVSSDRDLSPPRVRRGRGGHDNEAFSSESSNSFDDSSSFEDEKVAGSFSIEDERDNEGGRYRSSFKQAKRHDLLDSGSGRKPNNRNRANGGNYRKTDEADFPRERLSRRDNFAKQRNPRSDSPLTVAVLEKHEQITRESEKLEDKIPRKEPRSRRKDPSPTRSLESSTVTQTSGVTEGTEFTATTVSSSRRYAKNESLRRNSPSRSSSYRRYKRDNSQDSKGRKRPRRTRSADDKSKESKEDRHRRHSKERSRSPGSSSSHSSRSSSRQLKREAKAINKKQGDLPIFAAAKKKNSRV